MAASSTGDEGGKPPEWGSGGIPTVDRLPGLRLPNWFQTLGRGAWLLVGIAVLLAIAFFVLGLISDLVIPLVFAAILAAIFVPLADRLERWRLPRWLAAPMVVLLAIGVVSVVAWMVVAGLVDQGREIQGQVTAGLEETGSLPGMVDLDAEQAIRALGGLVQVVVSGLLSGLGSVTVLIVGIVTGLLILLFLMKDWRLVSDGTASQIAALLGLPDRLGRQIVADTVQSFRGYALGLTVVGLMNGLVVGLGSLLFGVLGATLAAPVTAVTLRTIGLLRDAGLFEMAATRPAAATDLPPV